MARLASLKRFEFQKKMAQQDEAVKKKLQEAKDKKKGGFWSRNFGSGKSR